MFNFVQSPTQVQREGEDNASTKKPRVVWSVEMHQQFVNAVNSLGIDSEALLPCKVLLDSGELFQIL